jgi:hypothetical protein
MGLMRPLATNSYSANRRAWSTIARSGSRLKAEMPNQLCANDPKQTFSTSWTYSSSETVANLMSPRRHHAGREPVPSSSWLFSVPWAVIVPMAVGGPFRIHSNITPINAPTTGPTI